MPLKMNRLDGRRALVTGSSTGIGRAIAARLLDEGARVLIHGIEPDLTAATARDLECPHAVEDLADPESTDRLVARAVETLGGLDLLINNAGIVPHGDIEETDCAFWDRTFAVNVRAPYLLIRAALPELAANSGRVLNIGSVNAHAGEPQFIAYSSSKGALMTLTRNLGDSLHRNHGVVVNQINPGWVLTENEAQRKRDAGLADAWYAELPPDLAPSGRILRPEEIAAAAAYWLSNEAGPGLRLRRRSGTIPRPRTESAEGVIS